MITTIEELVEEVGSEIKTPLNTLEFEDMWESQQEAIVDIIEIAYKAGRESLMATNLNKN